MVIIAESFAREYWGSPANAIGKSVRVGSTDPWHEVIGVAGNVYDDGVSKPASSVAYWPLYQDNFETQKEMMRRYVNFVIRSPRAGQAAFRSEIQQAVWSVDRDLPLADQTTVGALYTKSMARTSFTLVMLCVAGIAVAFGVMRLMASILFHVRPVDPWTYASATGIVLLIAWIACYLPSRKAAAVDPVHALRAE